MKFLFRTITRQNFIFFFGQGEVFFFFGTNRGTFLIPPHHPTKATPLGTKKTGNKSFLSCFTRIDQHIGPSRENSYSCNCCVLMVAIDVLYKLYIGTSWGDHICIYIYTLYIDISTCKLMIMIQLIPVSRHLPYKKPGRLRTWTDPKTFVAFPATHRSMSINRVSWLDGSEIFEVKHLTLESISSFFCFRIPSQWNRDVWNCWVLQCEEILLHMKASESNSIASRVSPKTSMVPLVQYLSIPTLRLQNAICKKMPLSNHPWAPKNKGLGHLKTRLFSIKTSVCSVFSPKVKFDSNCKNLTVSLHLHLNHPPLHSGITPQWHTFGFSSKQGLWKKHGLHQI